MRMGKQNCLRQCTLLAFLLVVFVELHYLRTPSPLPRPRRSVMDAMSADRLATASSAEAESTAGKKLKQKKKRSVIKKEEDIEEGLTA